MKRVLSFIALAALVIVSASCSKSRTEQMAMAENLKIACTPEVLECVAGNIDATVSVTYPDGYFYPKALLVVTPVLVYEGGSQTGSPVIYQGEKVKDNNRVVPEAGGTVSQPVHFVYEPGVEKSHLELQCVAFCGKTRVEVPAIKVADGCNTTYMLATGEGKDKGSYTYKSDDYQDILHLSAEGQIKYDVNSDVVKKSELRSESVKDFQEALKELDADQRVTVTGNQIVAYASPEGGEKLNSKLTDKRANTAQKAWDKITKGRDADDPQIKSMGQDWEGFQAAIENSNLEDKELILRVLSMYSDPAVRESEIRNMSQVFTEMKKSVFPELRRARFITNYDYKNYTEEELKELAENYVGALDEEALLRVASLTTNVDRKRQLYKLADSKFNSQRAAYNLAAMSVDAGDNSVAEVFLKNVDANDPDALNLKGVLALRDGKIDQAINYFKNSGSCAAKENLGVLNILNGKYADAAAALKGTGTTTEAIANLLAGKVDAAEKCLTATDAVSDYVRAIVAARKGDSKGVASWLKSAGEKDPQLKARAAKDIEFANYR